MQRCVLCFFLGDLGPGQLVLATKMSVSDFDDEATLSSRVEVFRDELCLNLKICDITVERLARVFKASDNN